MTKKLKILEHNVVYYNNPFIIKKYEYNIQYYPYYRSRLNQMKRSLILASKQRWPGIPIHTINDLADSKTEADNYSQDSSEELLEQDKRHDLLFGKDVVVCGMILKRMPLQPNILKELDDERKLIEQINDDKVKKFHFTNDQIFLQDNDESIELKGDDFPINQFCTGLCLAVKGQLNPNGSGFIVEDYCFAFIQNSIERPLIQKDYYILMVSGLNFQHKNNDEKFTQSLNLLFDLITGQCEQNNKTIVNIIIAGNSISSTTSNNNDVDTSIESIKILDNFLANIGQYMFVDIMPGSQDLSTGLYPQQPMHPCLFPKACHLSSIRSTTNPHRAKYFDVDFLGTSGENIDSIRSCTIWNEPIEIMRNLLQWGHLSPTCPDLLHSYPYSDNDPLVIDKYPDVFFAGNQPEFCIATFDAPISLEIVDNNNELKSKTKTILLISIPSFKEKQIAVLINIRTLECEMLAFN